MFFNKIPVLYCHSVAPQRYQKWVKNFLTLELRYFEAYLRFIIKNKYQSIFFDEYFAELNSNTNHRQNFICLNFDDGYLDNYVFVFPLLKKYGIKATIFISPDFVDKRNLVRKTLQDYWENRVAWEELISNGFLTWEEMRLMQKSGLVDIQSHTLTHTKYFISDKLTGFHHPGSDSIYLIGNLFPEKKPFYITDPDFETLVPYGYPYFEEQSAIIARRIFINEDFNLETIEALRKIDWNHGYNFESAFKIIQPIYDRYFKGNKLIIRRESEREYEERVHQELDLSKKKIEKEMGKKVHYCCWPHGDNNDFAHKTALEVGYKATTVGKYHFHGDIPPDRIPTRIGLGVFLNSQFLSSMKLNYKIKSFQRKQPYYGIKRVYESLRYRRIKD